MRHPNVDWSLPDKAQDWTQAQVAILMDIRDRLSEIRDEVKRTNIILYCENFIAIPRRLREIERNTRPRRRKIKPSKTQ